MTEGYCWFDIDIGGTPLKERVIIELFDDLTPKTCKNFRKLCLGNDGKTLEGTNIPMTYKGCIFHRVISGFMIQSGDYTNRDGTGGVSIYGEKFPDENFKMPCERPGLLAMANAGPDTNGSQFFITTSACPHLNGRHVVFGRIVRGMNSVRAIEHTPTGANDKPDQDCTITDCGVLTSLPSQVCITDGDAYPEYPEDCEPQLSDKMLIDAGGIIKEVGNQYFREGDYKASIRKYSKAIRYLQSASHTQLMEPAAKEKLIACYNNMATCFFTLEDYRAAEREATQALSIDKNNLKALFRRGVACLKSGDTEGAIRDLSCCLAIEPMNKEIAAKISEAKDNLRKQEAKLAAGLKKMFS